VIELRRVESDPDYEAWRRVRLAVVPNERAPTLEDLRTRDDPTRLLLVAELDGELAGSGIAQRADTGDGYVTPRVVPRLRGRGVGTALLEPLLTHVAACGFARARAHAVDEASLAFALRRGFEEVDRQVEQIRAVLRAEMP
jgi:GNAT superfamily N-acetyltransferase